MQEPLTVAWFSFFPVEWLADAPEEVRRTPKLHPASWQRVLLAELEGNPGLRLHIIVLRKQFERSLTFERNGVTFHLVKMPGGLRATTFFWLDTMLIRRVLLNVKPHVVHAWGTEQGAALVAQRLRYPHVVTMQGLFNWIKEFVPLNRHQRFASFLERWSLPKAPCITAETGFAAQFLRSRLSCSNVHQVEHAPDWIFHRLERRPTLEPLRFVSVASPSYLKGTDLLLKALDELKAETHFELRIVGKPEPGFVDRVRTQVSSELWRQIRFKQDLSPAEVAGELTQATMVVLPTRVDTSPNSVKEAVVAGVPVIGSKVGGIPDYVFPGQNGLLFEPNDLSALTRSLRVACQHPLFSQGQVEPGALKRVRAYLSPEQMGRRFLELYGSVAGVNTAMSP